MDHTKRPNSEIIMEAIEDLHAKEVIVTRETLAEVTGLKMTTIDDRVATLIDDGRVLRVQRGVFVPAPQHAPARIISKTILPGGTVKIEIGDDHVLTLTPREDRVLGALQARAGQEHAEIQLGNDAMALAATLAVKVRMLEREVKGLKAAAGADTSQLDFLTESTEPAQH